MRSIEWGFFLGLAGATIAAPAAHSQDSDADDDAIIEKVIVTGMRTSVESALLIRRNSVGVVDAISASDIARLSPVHNSLPAFATTLCRARLRGQSP